MTAAIRRIGTPRSVRFLVDQLASQDRDVEFLAVITLAEITGKAGDFAPAMDVFERHPEKYRTLWQDWWRTEGAKSR